MDHVSLPRSGWAEAADAPDGHAHRPLARDAVSALVSLLATALALLAGLALTGVSLAHDVWWLLLGLGIGFLVIDLILSPVLRALAARGSALLALTLGLGAQLAVLATVVAWSAGSEVDIWRLVSAVLLAAAVLALVRWLVGATDSGYIVGAATRRTATRRTSRRRASLNQRGQAPRGLLVVQLDGVSLTILDRAIEAGQAPNLARWLGQTHREDTWWKTIPSTTPATMAGVLHGDDQQVPAFRWWDRETGRLLAVSRPADASLIEDRFETGNGLLRDGGTAISTTFGGEADQAFLTISHATGSRGLGSGATYLSFFARPFLFPGALVLSVGEMVKELYQARRQKVRDVQPRISRSGSYVVLRGITNVLLRKLNLSLVAQEMAAGRPIIFVDFVDYDEIAHHAGPERPESMRALEGLDAVLGLLQQVATATTREYELVVISDHGQSLGRTFAQLTGSSLEATVTAFMSEPDSAVPSVAHTAGEEWGPVNALVNSVLSRGGGEPTDRVLGPDGDTDTVERPEVAVTGGGNLGMVWFPRLSRRPDLRQLTQRWPRLVPGLISAPGIGLVMATDHNGQAVVFGPSGVRNLGTGSLEGDDPLAGYPTRTAADLLRLHGIPRAGDLVIISTVDDRGHVHAFENQVGSHGGIGGQQNQALLVHPTAWPLDDDLLCEVDGVQMLVGPVALHRQLHRWRTALEAW